MSTLVNVYSSADTSPQVPVGSIVMWGGDTTRVPAGWHVCDGTAVEQATYSTLWQLVGNNFGTGAGDGKFFLPDLRGRFIRGFDDGAGRDPDSADRQDMQSGDKVGDQVGSIQGDNVGPHTHEYDRMFHERGDCESGSSWHRKSASTGKPESPAGSETRPINAYLIFIIRLTEPSS